MLTTHRPISLWRRISASLYGYDFFISYRWHDGGQYAGELAAQLRERGFEVFLDKDTYQKGDCLDRIGRLALKNTSYLVLVGSPGAIEPPVRDEVDWVLVELRIFSQTGRPIIPIDFGGSLLATNLLGRPISTFLPSTVLRLHEPAAQLNRTPSAATVEEITRAFQAERRTRLRIRYLRIIALLLLGLSAALVVAYLFARDRQRAAERATIVSHAEGLVSIAQEQRKSAPLRALKTAISAVEWTQGRMQDRFVLDSANEILRQTLGDVQSVPLAGQVMASDELGATVLSGDSSGAIHVFDLSATNPTTPAFILEGRKSPVTALEITPDGGRAVVATADKGVRIWDLSAKPRPRQVAIEAVSEGEVITICISTDGRRFVTADKERNIHLWDAPTLRSRLLQKSSGEVSLLEFSRESQWLLAGTKAGPTTLWQLPRDSNHAIRQFPIHDPFTSVRAAAFNPDGSLLSLADTFGRVWLISLAASSSNFVTVPLGRHEASVLRFGPTGDSLYAGGLDARVLKWDIGQALTAAAHRGEALPVLKRIEAPKPRRDPALDPSVPPAPTIAEIQQAATIESLMMPPAAVWEADRGSILDLAIAPDESYLVAGCEDRTVRIFDRYTKRPIITGVGHQGGVYSVAAMGGTGWITTASSDRTVRLWRLLGYLQGVQPVRLDASSAYGLPYFVDNAKALLSDRLTGIVRWSLDPKPFLPAPTPITATNLNINQSENAEVVKLLTANGDWVVTSKAGHTLQFSKIDGTQSSSPDIQPPIDHLFSCELGPHSQWALVSASRSNQPVTLLLTCSPDSKHFRLVNTIEARYATLRYTPDAQLLAGIAPNGAVRTWNLDASLGQVGRQLSEDTGYEQMALVGEALAVVSKSDGTLYKTGLHQRGMTRIGQHGSAITVLLRTEAREWVLSGSSDGEARLWIFERGQAVRFEPISSAGMSPLISGAMSADGHYCALGRVGGTVDLVELSPSGKVISSIRLPGQGAADGGIERLVFSGDSRWLLTRHQSSATQLWLVPIGEVLTLAKQALGRTVLSDELKARFETLSVR